jgi:hypothetical protein
MFRARITRPATFAVLAVLAVLAAMPVAGAAAAPAKPRFEFAAVKKHVTSEGGASILETVSGTKVMCKNVSDKGTIPANGANAVHEATVTFTGCEADGFKCETVGGPTGEIQTNLLKGQLGYLGAVESGKVGVDLVAETGELLAEIECAAGFVKVKLRGGIIGEIAPINVASKEFSLTFAQASGKQEWSKIFLEEPFESGKYKEVSSVPEVSVDGFAFKDAGLESLDEIATEENVKVVG